MKKTLLVVISALLILVGCTSGAPSYQVSSTDIITKLENKESFVLYVGSRECGACKAFAPTFQEFSDNYEEFAYSIEIIGENANNKTDYKALQDDYIGTIEATPTIIVIQEGKVVDKNVGALKYSELETYITRFNMK